MTVVLAGRLVTGLRGIKYGAKQEKELLHAKGNKPHSIQRGNKTYDGEITLLQSEYEALRKASGGDILDASMDIVAAYGNPTAGDVITTDMLIGVEFTEDSTEWKQGDKFQEKTLPFIYLDKKSL
ncbi:MAG: hypothetical protein SPF09_05325 [Bacteroidaceae bacterium]|nr:hypothetical protein [Bacteroidaceae bacterium]